jgi:TonB family protein
MLVQFNTYKAKQENKQVVIDFVDEEELKKQIEEKKAELKKEAHQELSKDISYQARNIAVNEAEKEGEKNIDQMVKDIKGELNISDKQPEQKQENKIQQQEEKKAEQSAKKADYTINEKGERTFYKGATTISYSLEGRMHVYLPVPVYKCQGSGKVVVEIGVNTNGFVVSTSINRAESKITDDCLEEAAIKAALTSRFNAKATAPDKQKGRITYIFIAQ